MTPKRSDEVLSEWAAVTKTATPPGAPPRATTASIVGPGFSLAGAVVLVVALVAAMAWLGNRDGSTGPGAVPSDTPAPSVAVVAPSSTPAPSATATPTPSPAATPTPADTPAPTPTPAATMNPCVHLAAPLHWEGAAGSRIAQITLTNRTDGDCQLGEFTHVRYVDGGNHALIEGPATPGAVIVPAHSSLSTLVEVSNYCGPVPEQPVGIIFENARGGILLVGSPASEADMSVPPCNGPGQPGSIQMQPWSGG